MLGSQTTEKETSKVYGLQVVRGKNNPQDIAYLASV